MRLSSRSFDEDGLVMMGMCEGMCCDGCVVRVMGSVVGCLC